MKTACRMLLLAGASLLLAVQARADRPKLTPALVAEGRASYAAHCAQCHGERGRGDGPLGGSLALAPRDFALGELNHGKHVTEVYSTVSAGVSHSPMPAFSELPERERWGVCYRVLILRAAGRRERLEAAHARTAAATPAEGTTR